MSTPWADQPYSLLSTDVPADKANAHPGSIFVFSSMCLAHNMFLRHLNSIYLQATGVHEPKDIRDFLFYCKAWAEELRLHHDAEEGKFFPLLDKLTGVEGIMAKSEQQHHAFMGGVHKLSQYATKTSPGEYSGTEVRKIIDEFAPLLLVHLREEPLDLLEVGELCGGAVFKEQWDNFEAGFIKEVLATGDKHILLPLAFGLNDQDFEGGKYAKWPDFPFFVPLLTRAYYARKYAGSWRFLPCRNRKRRKLEFLGEGWQSKTESPTDQSHGR
ncbi:hypothetical protein AOCH_004599 [Aspergillus ochraceoroseus]|nr:hypothetical protein AOCH_004599 [Aspergillus ochraceoroseus]